MLKPLSKNSTIGVLAPAFPPDAQKLQKGAAYLHERGHRVIMGKTPTARHGYFAGNDQLRLEELQTMFANPEIDMIICARGGWGTLRLLNQIDYALLQAHPKALVGYSDITTLQLAFWKKAGLPSLSGPMVAVEMGSGILPFTERHFWDQIYNPRDFYSVNLTDAATEIWKKGRAAGPLLGGCLSMVSHQLGTPYSPDYTGAVLLLEDVGEEPYKIDRYLAHLKQAGVFGKISALILGNFLECEDENPARNMVSIHDVLAEYFSDSPFPVVYDFPYGHGMKKITMPIGARVELDATEGVLTMENIFKAK